MVKRRCPVCNEAHYSADTTDQLWACRRCGAGIGKEREESAEGGGE